jgi:hypothetical protein
MKIVTYRRREWTIQVKEDRAPVGHRRVNHGINTVIGEVPGILCLTEGRGAYNACGCGICVRFHACQKTKGVAATTNSCQMRPSRFQSKEAIS